MSLEEGFLANEDETVFWVMDEHEAWVARRFKRGKRPRMRPGSPGRAKGGKDQEVVSGPIAQTGELTGQTFKSIHPIPVVTVRETEKERKKVAGAKEKERTQVTKGRPLKGAKKGKQADSAKAASSTEDQANASPRVALEPMKPPYRTGMNGTKTAIIMLIKDGAIPHITSNSLTRMPHLPRVERRERRKQREEQKDQMEDAQIRIRRNVPRQTPARVIPFPGICHNRSGRRA